MQFKSIGHFDINIEGVKFSRAKHFLSMLDVYKTEKTNSGMAC